MKKRSEVEVSFIKECDSDIPVIRMSLDDTDAYAIVDTGSEMTVFDEKFLEGLEKVKIKELDGTVGFSGIDGSSNVPKRCARLKARFPGDNGNSYASGKINGLAYDLSGISKKLGVKVSAIIGGDTLRQFNARIDCKQRVVTLGV